MQTGNHPIEPELIMAYLDGELPAVEAVGAAAHLEQCAECRGLADDLRNVSQSLAAWEVEPASPMLSRPRIPAPLVKVRRRWFFTPKWAFGIVGLGAVLFLATVVSRRQPASEALSRFGATEQRMALMRPQGKQFVLPDVAKSKNGAVAPMIARTAELQLTTRDFDRIRGRLDDILKRHKGYFGELNVNTPTDAGRTLQGKLQVPSDQLEPTISDIKQLGHVDSESQNGEEVTASYTDLEARLANARHTEQRMVDLLRERTGKLSDVLEAEQQLGRIRGEIEQMEAQRRGLLKRVDYSTLTLTVNEEYKAQLHGSDSTSTQLHNAAVDGFRGMAGSVLGVGLFLLSSGPVLLLWLAILFFPARFAWRRWKARRS